MPLPSPSFAGLPSPIARRPIPQLAGVWRADDWQHARSPAQPTGYAALDAQLPGGGWPAACMVQLLQAEHAHAEWALLLPGLAALMARQTGQVVLVAPPYMPLSSSLQAGGIAAQRLCCVAAQAAPDVLSRAWAAEQALRCRDVLAVLVWLPQAPSAVLRRLQWSAAQQGRWLWTWGRAKERSQASPAALRLQVSASLCRPSSGLAQACLQVELLKRQGPPLEQVLQLPLLHWAWSPVLQAQGQRQNAQASEAAQLWSGHGVQAPGVAGQVVPA